MSEDPPRLRGERRMKGFEPAGGILRQRIRAAGESRGFAVARVLTHWDEIAGPELARVARPVRIGYAAKGGLGATLTLLTNGANAPVVEMQKEALRQKVNACYGYNAVSRIAVTQTAACGFSEAQEVFRGPARQPPAAAPAPAPAAAAAAAAIRDPALRAAVEDLGRSILSRPRTRE